MYESSKLGACSVLGNFELVHVQLHEYDAQVEQHLQVVYVDSPGIGCCAELVADRCGCCSCKPGTACAHDPTGLQVLQAILLQCVTL